jgi:hypothetical protein
VCPHRDSDVQQSALQLFVWYTSTSVLALQQVLSPCRPAVKRTWSVLLVRQHSSVGREPLMTLRGLFTVQFISKPASPTLR